MPDPVLPDASFCRAPAFSRCPRTHLPGTDTRPEAQHGDSAWYCPLGPDQEDRPRPPPEAPPPGGAGPSLLPVGGTRAGAPGSPSVLSPLPRTRSSAHPVGPRASSLAGNLRQKRAAGSILAAHAQVGGATLTARPLPEAGAGAGGSQCPAREGEPARSSPPGAPASGTGWRSGQAAARGLFIWPGQAASLKTTNQR